MLLPDAVKRVSECVPGKRIKVISAGKSYEIPVAPEPEPEQPPNPLDVIAKQLLDRDADTRALIAARSEETLNAVKEAVVAVVASQKLVVDTLMLPVVPKYDKNGLVVEGRRQKEPLSG